VSVARFVILLILLYLFLGCESKSRKETAGSSFSNDLVQLNKKRIKRPDRKFSVGVSGVTFHSDESSIHNADSSWKTENVTTEIESSFRRMFTSVSEAERLLGNNFRGVGVMPTSLEKISLNSNKISLWVGNKEDRHMSKAQFIQSLHELLKNFSLGNYLKVIEISNEGKMYKASIIVDHLGERKEAHSKWICEWGRRSDGGLELLSLERKDYSELRSERETLYKDFTHKIIGQTPNYDEQVDKGISEWAGLITKFGDMAMTGHHGLAVGDVNGDGRDDVFVCDGGSLPNRLYVQNQDGTAMDISMRAGIDWYEDSRAALLLDLDNDGDQDLVVATIAMIVFAENDGTGQFTIRGGFPDAQYPFSLSSSDFDLDGDLDVYVCLYGEGDRNSGSRGFDERSPIPFHDAKNGGRNVLLVNHGGFAFTDETESVGLDVNNDRWSFSASWEDYDNDGDPDLYVANDFGRNCLYRNDRGHFTEEAKRLGLEDTGAGMSVSWGDYDRDGIFDLYIGNMFSAAGNRIGGQDRFASDRKINEVNEMRKMSRGNTLYRGTLGGFSEVSRDSRVSMGRWAWSSGFVDIDNDGWEDIVITNGYITGWKEEEDL